MPRMRLHLLVLTAIFMSLIASAHAQWRQLPTTGSEPERVVDRTTLSGQSGMGPTIHAMLVDPDQNAKQHRIIVQVDTWGVNLVGAERESTPRLDQAHFEYYLDRNEPLITTSRTAVFGDVGKGDHVITVLLADSQRKVLGMRETLKVHVP